MLLVVFTFQVTIVDYLDVFLRLPVALNYQSDALKNGNGRRGINRCMICLQTSEFERVSNNDSH